MQQISKVNLKAIKRCDQYWNDMEPITGGRQCAMCNKKITDFREKSLKEIADIHVNSNEPVCGVYTEHQLNNEENPIFIEPISWWNSIKNTYLSLASFLLTLSVSAQDTTDIQIPKIEQNEFDDSIKQKQTVKNQYLISGIISDFRKKIEYANLIIKKDDKILIGTSTDKNGYYQLDLSSIMNDLPEKINIEIVSIGYPKRKMTITKSDFKISNKYYNLYQQKSDLNLAYGIIGIGTTNPVASSFGVAVKKGNPIRTKSTKKESWLKRSWKSIKSFFSKK